LKELECLNKLCWQDKVPTYDWRQSELLKFNGTWYLGPKGLYSSGMNGAYFAWPIGDENVSKARVEIHLNGRGSWLIPADASTPRPPSKSNLDEARDDGDPIKYTSLGPGLERYEVERRTPYGIQPFSEYIATNRNSISGEGHPTLTCRSGNCSSGDSLQPDLFADYRVNEENAKNWPEIHAEIVRVLGLLVPIGPAEKVDLRPKVCK
jgi:hypothetical protein